VKLRNKEFKPKLSPEYFYCLLQYQKWFLLKMPDINLNQFTVVQLKNWLNLRLESRVDGASADPIIRGTW